MKTAQIQNAAAALSLLNDLSPSRETLQRLGLGRDARLSDESARSLGAFWEAYQLAAPATRAGMASHVKELILKFSSQELLQAPSSRAGHGDGVAIHGRRFLAGTNNVRKHLNNRASSPDDAANGDEASWWRKKAFAEQPNNKCLEDFRGHKKGTFMKLKDSQLAHVIAGLTRPDEVSEDCARYLGAVACMAAFRQGKLVDTRATEVAQSKVREILGIELKTALTTSDIPLPVEYSSEIVEFVSRYGTARRWGTVVPLGAGTAKLPRLKTDPVVGLIGGMSQPIPEKSPQMEFVTFTAEKFGGLVRMPTEIDEDSIVLMGQFLARYGARNIALCEDATFWKGDGSDTTGTPNGSVKGLVYSVIDNSKVVQMAATKTHYSDASLANFRALRAVPDEAALYDAAYYMHPTFEQLLATFNAGGDRPYNPNAQLAGANSAQPFVVGPTLDGFPIRWVNTLPAYSTSANVSKVFVLFGDASYQYLGIRGGIRFDASSEAAFATDEVLVRILERYQIGLMAVGAVGGLETAAS